MARTRRFGIIRDAPFGRFRSSGPTTVLRLVAMGIQTRQMLFACGAILALPHWSPGPQGAHFARLLSEFIFSLEG